MFAVRPNALPAVNETRLVLPPVSVRRVAFNTPEKVLGPVCVDVSEFKLTVPPVPAKLEVPAPPPCAGGAAGGKRDGTHCPSKISAD